MGTRKWYPYPWARVWVYAGTGPGGPKNTRGLPVTNPTPDTCRHCGKTGHWAKDCDLRFDVRYMDTDELEKELENKFVAKDVASVETLVEGEEELGVEDFVSRSG